MMQILELNYLSIYCFLVKFDAQYGINRLREIIKWFIKVKKIITWKKKILIRYLELHKINFAEAFKMLDIN